MYLPSKPKRSERLSLMKPIGKSNIGRQVINEKCRIEEELKRNLA